MYFTIREYYSQRILARTSNPEAYCRENNLLWHRRIGATVWVFLP